VECRISLFGFSKEEALRPSIEIKADQSPGDCCLSDAEPKSRRSKLARRRGHDPARA